MDFGKVAVAMIKRELDHREHFLPVLWVSVWVTVLVMLVLVSTASSHYCQGYKLQCPVLSGSSSSLEVWLGALLPPY